MAVKMANIHTKLFNSIRYHRIVNNNKNVIPTFTHQNSKMKKSDKITLGKVLKQLRSPCWGIGRWWV